MQPDTLIPPLLGAQLAEYRARPFNTIGGPALTILGILFLLISFQINRNLVLLAIIGLFILPFGLLITLFGFTQPRLRVVLYTDGFSYQRGRTTTAVQWTDIAHVQSIVTRNFIHFIYAGKTYTYTIETRSGTRIVLNDTIQGIRELGERIEYERTLRTSLGTPPA